MNNIRIICLFLLAAVFTCSAQTGYQPLEDDEKFRESILTKMDKRYESDIKKLKGDYKKEIKKEYTKRYEKLHMKMENGHFLTNPKINQYFNGIFNKILLANPILAKRDTRLLVSRYYWPNASCHGEGTIVLNLGLISRLENESQIAFVLCHELAHDYLNHVNKAIRKQVRKLNSKATKKKLKKIKKNEYNSYEQATELLNSLIFDMRKHSRLHESEADSMALIFMAPTPYDTREAAKCIAILDKIDNPKRPGVIDLKKHFDSESFTIRDNWLTIEESSSLVTKTEDKTNLKDSLKTHPDCKKRIKTMERLAVVDPTDQTGSPVYQDYIHLADYEIVESRYLFGEYGQALFYAFLLVEEHPNDVYLHTVIMDCLYELAMHQKNHQLGKILDLPDQSQDQNYNQYLHFIHNLRFRDLKKLSYYYGLKQLSNYADSEDFRIIHLFAASLVLKEAEWKKDKEQYFKDFSDGDYKKEVREFKPIF